MGLILRATSIPRWALPALLLPIVVVAGCRHGHRSRPPNTAEVRVIDAVPADRFTIYAGGRRVVADIRYGSGSNVADLQPGTYHLRIVRNRDGRIVAATKAVVRANCDYSVLLMPAAASPEAVDVRTLEEPASTSALPPGEATLRFIDASPDGDMALALNNIVAVNDEPYGAQSRPVNVAAGKYDAKLCRAADVTGSAIVGPQGIRLRKGSVTTLVAMGRQSDGTIALCLFSDD